MKLDYEEHIIDIVENASHRLGGVLRIGAIRPIDSPLFKDEVADATQAFFVDGASKKDDCVLIISSREFPDFVNESVQKALYAQSALGSQLGTVVCTPLLTGTWDSQSYAVYERLDGYSRNRYLKRLQSLHSSNKIISWSSQVFHKTMDQPTDAEDIEERFIFPLRSISSDRTLDSDVCKVACALESGLKQGQMRSFNCLEHGDFWIGNVLFTRGTAPSLLPTNMKKFKVIDWAGSSINGYPGIDALRFSLSAFGQGKLAYEKLVLYCKLTGLTKAELGLSCVCALGRLAVNLNQFPKERFNKLALRTTKFLHKYDFVSL